jgi:Kdo2-lipid IVA lauroyltransferase/acyltransferase
MENMSSTVSLKTFLSPRYWYAWPVLALMLVLSWMPGFVHWILGSALGEVLSCFPTPNKRFAKRNVELCFPEKSPKERRSIVKRHFRLSGYATLSLSISWFAPQWRIKRFIRLRDAHHIEDAYKGGRNVILLAPHFIGLDIGGMRTSLSRNFVSMYRMARNPLLEYLFQRRSRYGSVVVERFASMKPIIRLIREGRPFYYLPDQDMGERASVFVPFFGTPAATVTIMSRIAETTNSVVIPCISRALPRGRGFEVRLYPPFENFPTDDPAADAARMNREIENWVREMPEQYMWTYRRFKTRPNGEKSLYEK